MYTAAMTDTSKPGDAVADALPGHWAERLLPAAFLPYGRLARLERPIGWWLLLLPCWWGLLLAQIAQGGGIPDFRFAFLFLVGAIVMRGAGCTLNDIIDRDFDGRVARTRQRPIASGQVAVAGAFVFLLLLALAGLAVLLQFNRFTVWLGVASLAVVAIYPFMKRVTYWPQFFLGLAFNWGALVGWSAVQGGLSAAPIALYAGGILWTLAYDTIYAHQDMEDDLLVGIKSTALKFGDNSRPWLAFFFAAGLSLMALAFWLVGTGFLAHMGLAGAGLHAAWQLSRFRPGDPARALALFRSNRELGLIIAAFLLLDCLIR